MNNATKQSSTVGGNTSFVLFQLTKEKSRRLLYMSWPGIKLRIRLGFSYNDIKDQNITYRTFNSIYNMAI